MDLGFSPRADPRLANLIAGLNLAAVADRRRLQARDGHYSYS